MATKSYSLEFDGYRREPNISGFPAKSGIYCVYACVHNTNQKTVSLNRLLYIGEAADVQDRVQNHEKWPMWRNKLKTGGGDLLLCHLDRWRERPAAGRGGDDL